MDKMEIYNRVRAVPPEAQKKIGGGRLSGMTDINPMWRIKTLTELFGPCGIGWYYTITKQWTERQDYEDIAKGEVAAFVNIDLYIKVGEEWSKPIPGTGGSMFVASEKSGMHLSDECYKMALTDALSVACKALGIGADVYWEKDSTKYTQGSKSGSPQGDSGRGNTSALPPPQKISEAQIKAIHASCNEVDFPYERIKQIYKVEHLSELTSKQASEALAKLNGMKTGG